MKLLYLPAFVLFLLMPAMSRADGIDNVISLLKQGNAAEISKLFADNVEVTILSDDNEYRKDDALPALTKFFSDNKPRGAKLLHKIDSNPKYLYSVVLLTTDKGAYRVSFALSKTGEELKLIELKIEAEKAK